LVGAAGAAGLLLAGAAWLATGGQTMILDGLAGVAVRASTAAGLTVEEVTVRGRKQVDAAELMATLGVAGGDPIIDFHPVAARKRLLALDWVEDARIARILPNTIRIDIVERRALALWQEDGRLALIDHDGVVLTRSNLERFAAMPLVVGAGAATQAAKILGLLATDVPLMARVQAAVLVSGRRWNVRLDNGITILLPDIGVGAAWRGLGDLDREHAILERDIELVDLRVPGRLVVRLSKAAAAVRRDPGEST
jgi:cell division protein FtsQ